MKILMEYLDRAVQLERLASNERDAVFKEQLLTQAQAYRQMAAKRAIDYGLPAPSAPEIARRPVLPDGAKKFGKCVTH